VSRGLLGPGVGEREGEMATGEAGGPGGCQTSSARGQAPPPRPRWFLRRQQLFVWEMFLSRPGFGRADPCDALLGGGSKDTQVNVAPKPVFSQTRRNPFRMGCRSLGADLWDSPGGKMVLGQKKHQRGVGTCLEGAAGGWGTRDQAQELFIQTCFLLQLPGLALDREKLVCAQRAGSAEGASAAE